jgi:cell wall-associated NlpC family hydrolase
LVIFNRTYDINKDGSKDSNDKYTHVGIWLGDNQFLQAASKGVTISTFNDWYKERFDSFRVFPGLNY